MTAVNTLNEILRARANLEPNRQAFAFMEGDEIAATRTYDQLYRRACTIAAYLRQTKGKVLLIYPPGLDYVDALFGCFYAGCVAIPAYPPDPMNLARTLPRLRHIIADARPNVIASTSAIIAAAGVLTRETPELNIPWIATDTLCDVGNEDQVLSSAVTENAVALLQYTSGSTTSPRGVVLSHKNLLENLQFIRRAFGHSSDSIGVMWLPLYHDMGLVGGVLQPIYAGFSCVLMSPLDFLQRPIRWLRAVSRFRATTSGGPDFAYRLCSRRIAARDCEGLDLSSWSVAFNGAEPVRADTLDQFSAMFGPLGFRRSAFLPCYGLAESTLAVACSRKDALPSVRWFEQSSLEAGMLKLAPPTSTTALVGCGVPAEGHQCFIINPTSRTSCHSGVVGEIWISGPSVAEGYLNRPQESEETFRAQVSDSGSEAAFLRTGDLGAFFEGELFITGRLKDLLIVRGRNYYPQDIEATVGECDSEGMLRINCGVAFTISLHNEDRLVVLQELRMVRPDQDLDSLLLTIRRSVADRHGLQLHSLALLAPKSLPKTSSGKIQRQLCRSLFLSGEFEIVTEWHLEAPK